MTHSPSPGARAGGRGEMMCLGGPNPHDVRVTCDVRVNPHQRTDTTDHPHTDTHQVDSFHAAGYESMRTCSRVQTVSFISPHTPARASGGAVQLSKLFELGSKKQSWLQLYIN